MRLRPRCNTIIVGTCQGRIKLRYVIWLHVGGPTFERVQMIWFRTLGGITLSRGGTEIKLPRKCAAILALLCNARGRPIRRSEIALLLWAGSNERAARHSLNQAFSTLRRILGRHSIATTDSSVTLVAKVDADFVELEK